MTRPFSMPHHVHDLRHQDEVRRIQTTTAATDDGMIVCGGCNGRGVVHHLSAYKRRVCEQCRGAGRRPPKAKKVKRLPASLEPTS